MKLDNAPAKPFLFSKPKTPDEKPPAMQRIVTLGHLKDNSRLQDYIQNANNRSVSVALPCFVDRPAGVCNLGGQAAWLV